MMTEDEAKEKWCFQTSGSQTGNCVGSACMAWRWAKKPETYNQTLPYADAGASSEGLTDEEPEERPNIPEWWVWSPASDNEGEWCGWVDPHDSIKPGTGYCGLAGAPQ